MEFVLFVFIWLQANDREARPPVGAVIETHANKAECEEAGQGYAGTGTKPKRAEEDGYPYYRLTYQCIAKEDVTVEPRK